MSPKLLERLCETRIFPDGRNFRNSDVLLALLTQPTAVVLDSDKNSLQLIKSGMLVPLDSTDSTQCRVRLVCPAVKSILLLRWLRPQPDIKFAYRVLFANDFDLVISDTIQQLDATRLRSSVATSAYQSTLLESTWQHEFYKAMCKVLPARYSFSCDVGRVFDSHGCIDFYINTELKWAIELAREGLRLREHVARFCAGGIYHGMVENKCINRWLVINFCEVRPTEPLMEHVLYVVYQRPSYDKYELLQLGHPPRTINISGSPASS